MPKMRFTLTNHDKDDLQQIVVQTESLLPTHRAEAIEREIGTKNYTVHKEEYQK